MPNSVSVVKAFVLLLGVLMIGCRNEPQTHLETSADEVARRLLDEERGEAERRKLAEAHSDQAAEILHALTSDLETDTEEEARRIPWIWRITIEAASQNEAKQIRQLIKVALPTIDAPLLNWQVVAVGGGIVNGISRNEKWPKERIREILEDHDSLRTRWQRAVDLSYEVAEERDVPYPWRYDALRMVAMDVQEESLPVLSSYLEPELDDHLHMGAISGLLETQSSEVAEQLLSGWSYFSERNRNLLLNGMMRADERTEALLDAISEGILNVDDLGEQRIERLKNHENDVVRNRAQDLIVD